jgi:hypothetical protein
MDLRFLAGGLLSGVGQGMATQGLQDILTVRQAALAKVKAVNDAALQTQRDTAAAGRVQTQATTQKELQTQRDTAAGDREKTKADVSTQKDAAAMARTRVSAGATVEAAKLRKAGSQGLLGSQVTDDQGNLWTVPKDGSAAQPVLDAKGNQLKSRGKPGASGPAPELEAERAVNTAIKLNTKKGELTGDPDVTDWNAVADTLDAKGFKTEAATARKRAEVAKPAPEPAAPQKPGLFQQAKDALGFGDKQPPPAPAAGGDAAAAAPAPAAAPATGVRLSEAEKDSIANDPKYNTKLTPAQEADFQKWKAQNAPNDSGYDYDLRGAYVAGLSRDKQSQHFDDSFKKPNHPSFSTFSKYAKDRPDLAGTWNGDTYVPAKGRAAAQPNKPIASGGAPQGQPLPRGADGKVDTGKLTKNQPYQLPDGRRVTWNGTSFEVLP